MACPVIILIEIWDTIKSLKEVWEGSFNQSIYGYIIALIINCFAAALFVYYIL